MTQVQTLSALFSFPGFHAVRSGRCSMVSNRGSRKDDLWHASAFVCGVARPGLDPTHHHRGRHQ